MIHTKMSILYYKAWYEIKMTNGVVDIVFFLPYFAAMSDDDVSTSFALDPIAQTLPRGPSFCISSQTNSMCITLYIVGLPQPSFASL